MTRRHAGLVSRAFGCGVLAIGLAACAADAPSIMPPVQPALDGETIRAEDGYPLPVRITLPDNGRPTAAIIAVHGFNDYSRAFDDAARRWRKSGIAVYAYDQRGFGRAEPRGIWPGTERLLRDLAIVTASVRARHPSIPIYHLGESMGAAIVLLALTDGYVRDSAGAILAAPAVWGREFIPWDYQIAGWIGAQTIPWYTVTGRSYNRIASDNIEMLRANGRDPLFIKATRVDAIYGLVDAMDRAADSVRRYSGRALILLGENDQLVPTEATQAMLRRLPDASQARRRVAVYAKGYHMLFRDLQGAVVQDDVAAWINAPAAKLPSGADGKNWWEFGQRRINDPRKTNDK